MPHVSGVAALLVSNRKGAGLVPDDIKDAIINTGRSINRYNPGFINELGDLVDATMALGPFGITPPDKVENLKGTALANSVNLSWTVPADEENGKPAGFNVYLSKKSLGGLNPENPGSGVIVASFKLGDKKVGDTFHAFVEELEFETKYNIAVSAYSVGRNYSELSDVITVTTGINSPPVINTQDKVSFTLKAHESHLITLKGSDPDFHKIAWSISEMSEGVSFNILEDNKAEIVINALEMKAGDYQLKVTLTDEYGAKDELNITFTVLSNNPPKNIQTIDNQVIIGLKNEQKYRLRDYISDEDGEELDYQLSSSAPEVATLTEEAGVLTLTTVGYGVSNIKITATDASSESVTQEFRILVKSSDTPLDLYPNPVKDKLWVRTKKEGECRVIIHNSAGAQVYNQTVTSSPFDPHAINVSSYAAGIYSVKVEIAGVVHKNQIIKQ